MESTPIIYTDLGAGINSAYEEFQLTNNTGTSIADAYATASSFSGPDITLATNETG